MNDAAAVFEGRPTGVVREAMQHRFVFEVTRVWKGKVGPRVEIVTASDSAACGRGYAMGSTYIVYAYRSRDGGLADGLCTRTRERDHALEDLSALGPGVEPQRDDAVDPGEPTHEPPRIDAPGDDTAPPPSTPSRRGCAVENAHTLPDGALLLLVGAGIAIRRRRIVRSPPRSHS